MTSTPGAYELHKEHLRLADDIDELRDENDYENLERIRRELRWQIDELGILYRKANVAVATTMPAEGFVVDGYRTYVVNIGDRRYVESDYSVEVA